ncbi:DUF262 domain-containing protein [Pseudomonas sp. 22-AL-CL-001]|uniref:DUF262 domain-containing protein n=1 Tax=Pseudomonas alabamensis TaxID=3064349 RepID=UPI00271393A0|nr:DUF262 domain-containing protein [Pseudomonas sp. 22-AL-CL-001]MDO7909213.1 DUF262 domain-containing protein [Pseudomonas sp. 22-AL-CL-001]
MSKRDPKPEVLRLEELAWQVKSGEIKLPRFQRPFVWNKSDMLKLLDSIYRGYPIGSILLWNSSQRLKSEREIAGLAVSEETTLYPTSYLLDGQQRLTTLCGALFWEGGESNSIWNIHFDLENESFVHPKSQALVTTYPLNRLINTTDFIQQCMKFSHHADSSKFIARAEQLLRAIKDYKIAAVMIGDMSLEEVSPIFERINSTGRKLTMVDLMMAATWSNGFDLSSEIKNIITTCENVGFTGVTEQLVLRSIAASAGLGVNKEDIQKLRNLSSSQLNQAATDCHAAFKSACQWLVEVLKVRDTSFLPYALFLTFTVELFNQSPDPSNSQLSELKAWFWYTSTTLHFGGASTGDISKDLASLRDYMAGRKSELFCRDKIDLTRFLYDKFNLKNASSTAFALLLTSKIPQSSVSGRPIESDLVFAKHSKNFANIGPIPIPEINISTVFHPFSGKFTITKDEKVLEQHFIDEKCLASIEELNPKSFLESRSAMISEIVSALTGCHVHFSGEYAAQRIIENDVEDSEPSIE